MRRTKSPVTQPQQWLNFTTGQVRLKQPNLDLQYARVSRKASIPNYADQ
ncbi:hypothetical protein AB1L42_22770 [Thalassoglobus sp. JC818]